MPLGRGLSHTDSGLHVSTAESSALAATIAQESCRSGLGSCGGGCTLGLSGSSIVGVGLVQ